jgi:hypothetical protein
VWACVRLGKYYSRSSLSKCKRREISIILIYSFPGSMPVKSLFYTPSKASFILLHFCNIPVFITIERNAKQHFSSFSIK